MRKKCLILVFGLFISANVLIAQEEGKFRVGLDVGYTVPSAGGGGALFYLEPKYNIKDNLNIGLRLGAAAMVRDLEYYGNTDEASGEVAANVAFSLTADHYFNSDGKNFAPFVGAGIGWVNFASVEVDTTIDDIDEDFEGDLSENTAFAPLLRAGFETGKFRLSLDYNFIPKSDLVNLQGDVVGETSNSFLGIAIGFYVGGGKWKN